MPTTTIALPSPSPGTQRTFTVYRYGHPDARPKAYFQAALHADEPPGMLVVYHLLQLLETAAANKQIRGEIVVVPVANPIGLNQYMNGQLLGRFDFAASGNFNRNFPELPSEAILRKLQGQWDQDTATNVALVRKVLQQAVTEQAAVKEVDALKLALLRLSIDADLVFDLHCDTEALLHLYASKHHRELALELGSQMGVATLLLEDDPGGIPFDEANAGPWWKLRTQLKNAVELPLACFATTVELRGVADVDDHYAQQDALNLYRFLQRRGVVAGDPGPLPYAPCAPTPLEGVDVLNAPSPGVVAYRKGLGEWVEKHETVAEIIDLTSENLSAACTPVHSRTSGIFFTRSFTKVVCRGQSLGKIAGAEPLAHRQAGKLLQE
jgi:predicted deacylase